MIPGVFFYSLAFLGIKTKVVDVTKKDQVESLAKDFDYVDVLFNVAGFVFLIKSNLSIMAQYWSEESDWDFTMNVNVCSMNLMIKAFLPKVILSFSLGLSQNTLCYLFFFCPIIPGKDLRI
ncbi:hypothetical protein cypCar_00004152 [Cyprinus carpio]|nr:hypothetical protein cypCar_00004152 [Cyprinus carpio]